MSEFDENGISEQNVQDILHSGQILVRYPEDKPYPSFLMLDRPIHSVDTTNDEDQETIVITVYEPNSEEWINGFTQQREKV